MQQEDNFPKGMFWGTLISIPMWLSFFGVIKFIQKIFGN